MATDSLLLRSVEDIGRAMSSLSYEGTDQTQRFQAKDVPVQILRQTRVTFRVQGDGACKLDVDVRLAARQIQGCDRSHSSLAVILNGTYRRSDLPCQQGPYSSHSATRGATPAHDGCSSPRPLLVTSWKRDVGLPSCSVQRKTPDRRTKKLIHIR